MPSLLSPSNFTHEASIAVPASVAGLKGVCMKRVMM
jgi:hypothetical protein